PGCWPASSQDERACLNNIDDDHDGIIDWRLDSGCTSADDDSETNVIPPMNACADNVDNDGDGHKDYGTNPLVNDSACQSASGISENKACNDNTDNDRDGKIDLLDPGCATKFDTDEYNAPLPACSDDSDNDGDHLVDFNNAPITDPGCSNALDIDETDLPVCGDGIDNDGDGKKDF